MRKRTLLALLILLFLPVISYAQFGKNNVRYHSLDQIYTSYRFDIFHNLDLNDPAQAEYLEEVVKNLEGARDWMSGTKVFNHKIEKRIPILLYKTHADMEASNLVGGFMREGVGAFAESERRRMVLKADFSGPLGRAIGVHELVHEFQFDIYNPNIIQRAIASRLPNGYYEGCAEFLAGLYEPHTRDDIRRREQRSYASNPRILPTWETLSFGGNIRVNPYTMWAMIPEFLEDKYSGGVSFCTQPLKSQTRLGEFVYDLAKGELGNPDINSEKFDQQAREYWGKERGFEIDRINSPNPYDKNNSNFSGRTLTPYDLPYPMRSPVLSPDGTRIAAFTGQNGRLALVRYDVPKENVYLSPEERKKKQKETKDLNGKHLNISKNLIKNLTPQLPPVPWEDLISQSLTTWSTFNGSDVAWSRDGKRIAFFAKINRDHALVIIDAESGKVLRKIEFEYLNQAFSPSFSYDGNWIFFSAAENVTRNLYAVHVGIPETNQIVQITNDERFDTAPSVSPDGTKLIYVGSDGDFQHLFMLELSSGIPKQLTFGSFNDSSPSWSDDGSTIVYTSDEAGRIWNMYTLNLATSTVSQWTEFIGGVETPLFARSSLDTVYYVVSRDDDQFHDLIYQNDEIFEAKLIKPVRQFTVVDKEEPNTLLFNPSRNLFKTKLDSNQLLNTQKLPQKWDCKGGDISFGVSTYWGMFGQSFFGCSNLLETKRHFGIFAMYGSYRRIEYNYLNQEKRKSWALGVRNYQIPLYYQFYDIAKRFPNQPLVTSTWTNELSVDLSAMYPVNKFNRFEFYTRLRDRSFNIMGLNATDWDEEILRSYFEIYTESDSQLFRLFQNSSGTSLGFGAAYVRDTVLSSQNTWGPLHGNALRAQVEVAPPVGNKLDGYYSTNVQARTYRRLNDSVLVAGRIDLMATSRASGDFMLLCGPDRGRGCDYGSVAGNQIAYGSVELRFPILDAIVGPGRINFGGMRGFLFADGALAKFTNQSLPAEQIKLYGFGVQYMDPFMGLPLQFTWKRNNGKWDPTFYITMSW